MDMDRCRIVYQFFDWPQDMKSVIPPKMISKSMQEELHAIAIGHRKFHLALMREPFLSAILNGSKTVESRFSRNRISPWGSVDSGDLILFAKLGGIVVSYAKALEVHYIIMSEHSRDYIETNYGERICSSLDPEFWQKKSKSKYATLIELGPVTSCEAVKFRKRDQRAWISWRF